MRAKVKPKSTFQLCNVISPSDCLALTPRQLSKLLIFLKETAFSFSKIRKAPLNVRLSTKNYHGIRKKGGFTTLTSLSPN